MSGVGQYSCNDRYSSVVTKDPQDANCGEKDERAQCIHEESIPHSNMLKVDEPFWIFTKSFESFYSIQLSEYVEDYGDQTPDDRNEVKSLPDMGEVVQSLVVQFLEDPHNEH